MAPTSALPPDHSVTDTSLSVQTEPNALSTPFSYIEYTLFDLGICEPTILEHWPPGEDVFKAIHNAQGRFSFCDAVNALRTAMRTHLSMDPSSSKLTTIAKNPLLWPPQNFSVCQYMHLFTNPAPPALHQRNAHHFTPDIRSVLHSSAIFKPSSQAYLDLQGPVFVPEENLSIFSSASRRYMNHAFRSIKVALHRQFYSFPRDFGMTRLEVSEMSLTEMIEKLGNYMQWRRTDVRNFMIWVSLLSDNKPLESENLSLGATHLMDFLEWLGSMDLAEQIREYVDELESDVIKATQIWAVHPNSNM